MPVFFFPLTPIKTSIPSMGRSDILSYFCNTPVSVVPFIKTIFYICKSGGFCRLILHIVKVFFASPFVKMWKFSYLKDSTEQHSLSYRYMWLGAFCIPISHIYPSVGYCIVYFSMGLTTTFIRINESQLHTFFV